jgi:hypothetical protein
MPKIEALIWNMILTGFYFPQDLLCQGRPRSPEPGKGKANSARFVDDWIYQHV